VSSFGALTLLRIIGLMVHADHRVDKLGHVADPTMVLSLRRESLTLYDWLVGFPLL
jgi:hypothetical protein